MSERMLELICNLSKEELERDFYVEAQMILKGLTGIQPELRHLEAMQEHHDCALIRIANMPGVDQLAVLEMP